MNTTQTQVRSTNEALNIAIDYMNERLEEHDAKYQRHPTTEAERHNILADIETVKEALAQQPQNEVRGLPSNEQVEPRAYLVYAKGSHRYFTLTFDIEKVPEIYKGGDVEPLYTHPPVPYVTPSRTAQPKAVAEQHKPEQAPHGLAAYVIGCFSAAQAEGLQEALAETTDERLKDLVERRLMYAFYAAQNTTPPQRKPLTDEQADSIINGLRTCLHLDSKRVFVKTWLRDWAAHDIKE